jgi:transposase
VSIADDLARLIGADATLLLIEARAGRRVRVPKGYPRGSSLAALIGADALAALAAEYGGLQIQVPRATAWRIKLYRARGLSYSQIAATVGVTEQAVHRNLKDAGLTNLAPVRTRAAERYAARREQARAEAAAKPRSPLPLASERDARALALRGQGLRHREIAERLGLTLAGVKGALMRARAATPSPSQAPQET